MAWCHQQLAIVLSSADKLAGCLVPNHPDSKVHGANMGPTWVLSAPDRSHVGPMSLAVRAVPNKYLGHEKQTSEACISKYMIMLTIKNIENLVMWKWAHWPWLYIMSPLPFSQNIWGVFSHKQVSRAGKSNCIPQYLWYVINCPCIWYLLLTQDSWYQEQNLAFILWILGHISQTLNEFLIEILQKFFPL